jgi:hypothetical protein
MHFRLDILAFLDKIRFSPDTSRYKIPMELTMARERESRQWKSVGEKGDVPLPVEGFPAAVCIG